MKKSKIILIILTAAVLTALTAFAVSSANDVMMTFDKGTEDTVTNMPQDEALTLEYVVPENVPVREGYDFLYWTLDYEAETQYTVRYIIDGTETELIPSVNVSGVMAFDTIIREAEEISGYTLVNDSVQSIVLDPDSGKNVITFYYKKATPAMATYTVQYVDLDFQYIAEDKVVENVYEGDIITEYPQNIYGYTPLNNEITWQVTDGDVIIFIYYYSAYNYNE